MKLKSKVKYVVLQEYIPASTQKAIKRSIRAALPLVSAPQAFVERLNQDLLHEARRRYTNDPQQALKTYGILSGSALSLAGGFLLWLLLTKQRDTPSSLAVTATTPSKQPVVVGQA